MPEDEEVNQEQEFAAEQPKRGRQAATNTHVGKMPWDIPLLENGLTQKQENFCWEYCRDFTKQAAAIRAGYSEASAHVMATDLYKMEKIRNRIREILKSRRIEYDVTVERVQQEISRIAFADPTKIIKKMSGKSIVIKKLEDIPVGLRVSIKSIQPSKEGLKITFHDKTAALEMLCKHLGYFEMDNKQKAVAGVAVYLPDNGRGGGVQITPLPEVKPPEGDAGSE